MRSTLLRTALAGAVGLTVLAVGPASAAPACDLVKDEEGDTFLIRSQDTAGAYGPAENSLDIVSGDIASDGKTVTGVLRLKGLAATAGTSPGGLAFRIQFLIPGLDGDTNLYMSATKSPSGELFAFGTRAITANLSTKVADVTGNFDVEKSEVRIHVPVKAFSGIGDGLKAGTRIDFAELDQTASRATPSGSSVFADVATSTGSYKAGDASCVAVGK